MATLTDLSAEERAAVTASNNIRGIDNLNVPLQAIGGEGSVMRQVDGSLAQLTDNPPAAVATPAATEGQQPLTAAERIQQDEELREYFAKQIESEKSRAVTGYREKAAERLAFEAAQKQNQETAELLQRAAAGDEEAQQQLGQNAAVQWAQKNSAAGFAQSWSQEAQQAVKAIAGEDEALQQQLSISNYNSTAEWVAALNAQAVAKEVAVLQAQHASEVEQLAGAMAVDTLAARRGLLPPSLTDLNQAANGGGFTRTGDWKTLSAASRQWNDGLISDGEFREAKRQYDAGVIPAGLLGID